MIITNYWVLFGDFVIKVKIILLAVCLLTLQQGLFCQTSSDTINQVDNKGNKQGYWKKVYPNGNTAYEANFKDNLPVGLLKRYYESGHLNVQINYDSKGEKGYAVFFNQQGDTISEGKYIGKKKDSIWNYYDANKVLKIKETYKNGHLHGKVIHYFDNGAYAEEISYKNGLEDGVWRVYFETGDKQYEVKMEEGKRNGLSLNYYPSGQVEIKGYYKNGKQDSVWKYYNEKGIVTDSIFFHDGIAENQDELDSLENLYLKQMEKNKHRFIDPAKYRNRPEEYMERSRRR